MFHIIRVCALAAILLLASGVQSLPAQDETTPTQGGFGQGGMTEGEIREHMQKRESAISDFHETHRLHTQVFQLRNVKAETFQKLAQIELKHLALVEEHEGGFTVESADGGRRTSGGFGGRSGPLAQIRETAVAIPETNSILVNATELTIQRVDELLRAVDNADSATPALQPFRVEVTLLRSMALPTAVSTSPTREIRVHSAGNGSILQNNMVLGKTVQRGDTLLQLENPRLLRERQFIQGRLSQAEEELKLAEKRLEDAPAIRKNGGTTQTDEQMAGDINSVRQRIDALRNDSMQLDDSIARLEIRAPVHGRIVDVAPNLGINLHVENAYIATIAEPIAAADQLSETVIELRRNEEKEVGSLRIRLLRVEENDEQNSNDDSAEFSINTGVNIRMENLREHETQLTDEYKITLELASPTVSQPGHGTARLRVQQISGQDFRAGAFNLARIGLAPDDFKEFGGVNFTLLGRSVIAMTPSAGNEGKAVVRIGDFECGLSYAGSQDAITLLRVILIADGKTLLESPVILNEAKPAILGITNLNDTLVLVARKTAD